MSELRQEEEQSVRFWVEALLKGADPAHAATELQSIGIRTRGAVRTRGSMSRPAPSRFPAGTDANEVLRFLQREAEPHLRRRVAAAVGEWGGPEALKVLSGIVVGPNRDVDPGVRSAALSAIAIIAGPESLTILEGVEAHDEEGAVRALAQSLIEAVRRAAG